LATTLRTTLRGVATAFTTAFAGAADFALVSIGATVTAGLVAATEGAMVVLTATGASMDLMAVLGKGAFSMLFIECFQRIKRGK
jgi:hypothetical protein